MAFDGMAHLRTRARVNGVEADAILDTGAACTVLDEGFARRLGLVVHPGFQVAGITQTTAGDWTDPIRLSLGDLTLKGLRPGALDLRDLTASAEGSASLIIGRELFERTIADFDFERGHVSFTDAATARAALGGHTTPLGATLGGTSYIPVALNGGPAVFAALDLGYNGSLMVSPALAEAAHLLKDRPTSTVASAGVEGMCINRIATCDQLEFAGARLSGAPIEVPDSWNRPIPAVLGLDVLRRFRMLTDYSRHQVSFIPHAGLTASPLPKDRSGIGGRPSPDGIVVIHVAAGSPAQAAGLKEGNIIRAINGDRADLDYVRTHPRMGSGAPGATFVLQIDDGRSVAFRLADYY